MFFPSCAVRWKYRTSAVCYILREMELERVLPYFRRLFFPWTRRRWKIFLISFASVGCLFEVPHLVVFNGVGFPFLLSNQILMLNKWWHNWAELFSDFCPSFETTTAYWCFRTTFSYYLQWNCNYSTLFIRWTAERESLMIKDLHTCNRNSKL